MRGMRVTAGALVGLVAASHSFNEILTAYPYLEEEDIRQALAYAAWRVEDRGAARYYMKFLVEYEPEPALGSILRQPRIRSNSLVNVANLRRKTARFWNLRLPTGILFL